MLYLPKYVDGKVRSHLVLLGLHEHFGLLVLSNSLDLFRDLPLKLLMDILE